MAFLFLFGYQFQNAYAQEEGYQVRTTLTDNKNLLGGPGGEHYDYNSFSGPLSDHGTTISRTRDEQDVIEKYDAGGYLQTVRWSLRTFYDAVARPGGVGFRADTLVKYSSSPRPDPPGYFPAEGWISARTLANRGLQISYTGPGPAPQVVETSVNMVFEGNFAHNLVLPPSDSSVPIPYPEKYYDIHLSLGASIALSDGGQYYDDDLNLIPTPTQRVTGDWHAINAYPFRQENATGALAAFPGMAQPGGFVLPISTPTGFLPVGADLDTFMFVSLHVVGVYAQDGGPEQTFSFNAMNSWSFATEGPVFNLPEGFTVNAPDLGIVNNRYTPIPESRSVPLIASVCAGIALLRQTCRRTANRNITGGRRSLAGDRDRPSARPSERIRSH